MNYSWYGMIIGLEEIGDNSTKPLAFNTQVSTHIIIVI